MRLIDADALAEELMHELLGYQYNLGINAPTVDAVPVIRCGYCKHLTNSPHKWYCSINRKVVDRDDYCSEGERRDK